jgi:hypothetical protein
MFLKSIKTDLHGKCMKQSTKLEQAYLIKDYFHILDYCSTVVWDSMLNVLCFYTGCYKMKYAGGMNW